MNKNEQDIDQAKIVSSTVGPDIPVCSFNSRKNEDRSFLSADVAG